MLRQIKERLEEVKRHGWSKYEKLEGKDGGMRPCPEWNSNKGICNLDSKTCMISQYDWQNCPKGEGKGE